jgi:peptidoglycan/LPS O-acetylase OafA/YrhL
MHRIKELDGLRALAIFGVLLVHFRPIHRPFFDFMALGWAGVDLFFVISGFLITGVLLKLRQHPTPFKEFYWRRTLRIFPPYYLVLLLILLLACVHGEEISRHEYLSTWLFLTSLTKHFPLHLMASRFLLLSGFDISPKFIDHHYYGMFKSGLWIFWSLSVEEIFYLLWAPIVLKGSMRFIVFCSLAPLIVCPVIRGLALTSSNFAAVQGAFATRFDTLAVGACLALLFLAVQHGQIRAQLVECGSLIAIPITALALALLTWRCGVLRNIELRSTLGFNIFGYGLLAFFCASVVAVSVRFSDLKPTRTLRLEPLVYVGSISYMLYLIHIPVYVAVGIGLARLGPIPGLAMVQGVLAIALAIALAALSWKYFEGPILKFKDHTFRGVSREQNLVLNKGVPSKPAA